MAACGPAGGRPAPGMIEGYAPPGKGSPTAPWDGKKTPVPWPPDVACRIDSQTTLHQHSSHAP